MLNTQFGKKVWWVTATATALLYGAACSSSSTSGVKGHGGAGGSHDVDGSVAGGSNTDGSVAGGSNADGSVAGGSSGGRGATGTGGAAGRNTAGRGGGAGAPGCFGAGNPCASSDDCCSGTCDGTTHLCTTIGACRTAGSSCSSGPDCCSVSCINGSCSASACVSDNGKCTMDGECCGGVCSGGTCAPLNDSCKTAGNTCRASGDCCSSLCSNGRCDPSASFCAQNGDACASDLACCGGVCTKASGAAIGVCSVVQASSCTPAGQACSGATSGTGDLPVCGGSCCSRSCRPYGAAGVLVCQPPSGCRPTGELCQTDSDCCGALGSPGSTKEEGGSGQPADVHCEKEPGAAVGACDNGHSCSPAGAICRLASTSCNATDRCCSGTVQQHPLDCALDLLGIPRCTVEQDHDCSKGAPPAGTACATSADCCNLPCVPNPAGTPPFVCGRTACVPSGGACTTTADCCRGTLCSTTAGSTQGTCAPPPPPPGSGGTPGAGGATGAGGAAGAGGKTGSGGTPPPSCAEYGQQCTTAADCCNSIPCTAGRCVFPIQ